MSGEELDEETAMMVERLAVLRIITKHISQWNRQMEKKEMGEQAGLLKFEEIKNEIGNEKSLQRWAYRCSHHFTKKVKRMLFEEIGNMVLSSRENRSRPGARRTRCMTRSARTRLTKFGIVRLQSSIKRSD